MTALLADGVLLLHLAIVVFVVGGLPAIVLGGRRCWRWTRAPLFRVAHLGAIGVVVLQAWLGRVCPLTTLESWLRARAGSTGYERGFVEHWVQRVLFYDAPGWVFGAVYTLFGAAVLLAWWRYPMRRSTDTAAARSAPLDGPRPRHPPPARR
jgi:hypothetical protein